MASTINGIPLFEALVTDWDTGMFCISLVDAPAVESDFLAFDANKRVPLYCVANEEKRIVRGVVMRANFPIYRYSEEMGEYYVTFSTDTIRTMAEKYLAEYRQNNVNLHHIAGSYVDGVHLVQYFLKDSENGISPQGFESIEDGSLFAEFQIHNPELWDEIKAGTFKGFSLEGAFVLERVKDTPITSNNMSEKMKKFKEALAKLVGESFAQVTTDKGVLRWETDEDLKAGDSVFYINEDGEPVKPEDGDYKTEDGKTIRVADGKVVEIIDDKAEVSEEGKKPEKNAVADEVLEERLVRIEQSIARSEETVARVEERVAELEKRVADNPADEAMSKVKDEVNDLREKLAKVAPKGIAQNFEETEKKIDRIAELAKLREEGLK